MKARSVVFPTAQKPIMLYGLPHRFTTLVVGGAFALFQFIPAIIGGSLHKISMPLLVVIIPALVFVCWKLGRKDWHIDSIIVCVGQFWPFRAQERWFLCGRPPEGHKAKKRRL